MKAYNGYTLLDQSVDSNYNSYSPSPRHPSTSRLYDCRARIAGRLRHGVCCLRENNTLKTVSGPFAHAVCTAAAPHTRAYGFRRSRAERSRFVSVTRTRTRDCAFRRHDDEQTVGDQSPEVRRTSPVDTAMGRRNRRENRYRSGIPSASHREPSDTGSAARPRAASVVGRPNYHGVVAR